MTRARVDGSVDSDHPDTLAVGVVASSFGFSLGAVAVVYALLALAVGYSGVMVGVFTALGALAQLVARFGIPWVLDRVRDRAVMGTACLCMALSASILLVSTTLTAFVVAQLLQGGCRAFFWTSAQAHVVRARGEPVRRLAQLQIPANVGTLVGPAVAGLAVAMSMTLGLAVIVAGGLLGALGALGLARRATYTRRPRAERAAMWRRPGIALGCASSFSAGGWRGLLDSFVPVILTGAGLGAAAVGLLIALSDGASMIATIWLARARSVGLVWLAALSAVTLLLGVAGLPFVAQMLVPTIVVLMLAGMGGGLLNTLAPAIVNEHAASAEQSSALALGGMYRSGARMVLPAGIAAAVPIIGVAGGMVVAAVALSAPILALGRAVASR